MHIQHYLNLFNTYSRVKQIIKPFDGKVLKLYTCGPTIYDFAHIGNFRTYVFEDLLRRILKFFGYELIQVMNITDVEDKTIRGAIEKNNSLLEYTEPFRQAFFSDLNVLNIEKAEFYPRATHYVEHMIDIIVKLLEKQIAYKGEDGSIYFSINKFPKYGGLSHLKLDSLKIGASQRIFVDEYDKENASDFVLWKVYDEKRDGNIYWNSPFGKGRPGWHIECSAMAIKLLGSTIDIHCGGVDNIFPHHENEIAQSESFTNETFVCHWAHAEHLIVEGKKMSKSLGNFYTLRDLLQMGYTGPEIRYMLMHTHYRTQLNFTFEGLKGAKASLQRIKDFIQRLHCVESKEHNEDLQDIIEQERNNFINALADDLNISVALAALFELIRRVNSFIDKNLLSKNQANLVIAFLKETDQILACLFIEEKQDIPQAIKDAFEKRKEARKHKNFALADELRDFIFDNGYIIEDMPDGARLKKR